MATVCRYRMLQGGFTGCMNRQVFQLRNLGGRLPGQVAVVLTGRRQLSKGSKTITRHACRKQHVHVKSCDSACLLLYLIHSLPFLSSFNFPPDAVYYSSLESS